MKNFLICIAGLALFASFTGCAQESQEHIFRLDLNETLIAFVTAGDNGGEVQVMDPRGNSKKKLTDGYMPCWSPDGAKIAFASYENENWDIFYINRDGSGLTRLTTDPAEDVYPAWSPDGTMIAFNSERSGSSQIWRSNVKAGNGQEEWGYNLTQLTQDTLHRRVNNFHAWSPDGLWLVFEADRDRDDPEIYLANAVDGTNQKRLTFTRALDEVPTWSPDGRYIIYSSDQHGRPQSGDYDIYIMKQNGAENQRLTYTEGAASNPSMSPDGTRIVYDVRSENGSEIFVMNRDGSEIVSLGKGSNPCWSPFLSEAK